MKLRYTPQAIADIREIKDYIRDVLHNPVAAERIARSILKGCASLKEFPKTGVSLAAKTGLETDLHMLVCGQYIALYRIDQDVDTVSVARIIHARQDYVRILLGETGSAEQEKRPIKNPNQTHKNMIREPLTVSSPAAAPLFFDYPDMDPPYMLPFCCQLTRAKASVMAHGTAVQSSKK